MIAQVAEKYADSLPHLAALNYITASVAPDDATSLCGRGGTRKCWWLTSVVKPLRAELAELVGEFRPKPVGWRERYADGDHAPLQMLVAEYEAQGNDLMVHALQAVAEGERCKVMQRRLDLKGIDTR